MDSQTGFTAFDKSDLHALAAALATIPAPRITKDPKEIGKQKIESAKHVPFEAILSRMSEANPEAKRSERDSIILATALLLLDSIGAIEVTENQTVAAVTEPAGHLFHSLSRFLKECAVGQYCYRPVRLDPDEQDPCKRPFLILARQAEEHRIVWAENESKVIEPIREHKITSVLIKGERTRPTTINGQKEVYLHVWNAGWEAYTLIGSGQVSGEHSKDTAYRALKEDLDIPRDEEILEKIKLRPSGVRDRLIEAYSPTHGAYTRYTFNLFWVEEIDGKLKVREGLKPRWFTYEEVCNQKATTGESIITNVELVQAIDLDKVPAVITDVRPFARPISAQITDLLKEIRDIGSPLGQLMKSVGSIILSFKWWLLLLLGMMLSPILLSSVIDRKLPGLSKVSDLLGIVGFIISLIGLAIKLQRSRK